MDAETEPPLQIKQDSLCDSPEYLSHRGCYSGDKSIRLHKRTLERRYGTIIYPCIRHNLGSLLILSLHVAD